MNKLMLVNPPHTAEVTKLRIEVHYDCDPDAVTVTAHGEGDATVFLVADNTAAPKVYGDVKKIREEFESVRSPEEALRFLKRAGPFRPSGSGRLSWPLFREWQRYLTNQRMKLSDFGDSPELFDDDGTLPDDMVDLLIKGEPEISAKRLLTSKEVQLKSWIRCSSVLEAVAALNFVDRINGKQNRRCLECDKVFLPGSTRGYYCNRNCTDKANREGKRISKSGKQVTKKARA